MPPRTPADVLQITDDIEAQAQRLKVMIDRGRELGLPEDELSEWGEHRRMLEGTARCMRSEVASFPEGSDYYSLPDFEAALLKLAQFKQQLETRELELDRLAMGRVLDAALPQDMLDAVRAIAEATGEPESGVLGKAAKAWLDVGKPAVELPASVEAACANLDDKRAAEVRWCYQAVAWWLFQRDLGRVHGIDGSKMKM